MATAEQSRESLQVELAVEVLREFGELRFVARGASMIPSIFPGDVLLVRREPSRAAEAGDVVLSRREGRLYAHRVRRTASENGQRIIITRGDALREDDPQVDESAVLGCVEAVVREAKRIEMTARPSTAKSFLAWLARHSDEAAKWLLRWQSLRKRIAASSFSEALLDLHAAGGEGCRDLERVE